MKAFTLFILSVLMIPTLSWGQNFEGTITYELNYKNLPDQSYASMLPKEFQVIAKNQYSLLVQESLMGSTKTIIDNQKKELVALMEVGSKKYAIKEVIPTGEEEQKINGKMNIETTKEKRKIAGYECTKSVIKDSDGNTTTLWMTDALKTEALINPQLPNQLKGIPLLFSISQMGMEIEISAKSVKKETIDSKLFEIPKEYQSITADELQELLMEGQK